MVGKVVPVVLVYAYRPVFKQQTPVAYASEEILPRWLLDNVIYVIRSIIESQFVDLWFVVSWYG